MILARIIAIFFREPGMTLIMKIMSISFIFSGLSVVPQALLIREMSFRRLAFMENVSFLIGAGIGVVWLYQDGCLESCYTVSFKGLKHGDFLMAVESNYSSCEVVLKFS